LLFCEKKERRERERNGPGPKVSHKLVESCLVFKSLKSMFLIVLGLVFVNTGLAPVATFIIEWDKFKDWKNLKPLINHFNGTETHNFIRVLYTGYIF